jgi:hypothetical protein
VIFVIMVLLGGASNAVGKVNHTIP